MGSASLRHVDVKRALVDELRELAGSLPPADLEIFRKRLENYRDVFELEFARIHPQDEVLGVHNLFRYQTSRTLIYLPPQCTALEALSCLAAARIVQATPVVLMSPELGGRPVFRELAALAQPCESIGVVSEAVRRHRIQRLRCPGRPPKALWTLPTELSVSITAGPAHDDGYVELRCYLNEQSVSVSYHRYGNLNQPQVPGLPRRAPDAGADGRHGVDG